MNFIVMFDERTPEGDVFWGHFSKIICHILRECDYFWGEI